MAGGGGGDGGVWEGKDKEMSGGLETKTRGGVMEKKSTRKRIKEPDLGIKKLLTKSFGEKEREREQERQRQSQKARREQMRE